MGDNIHVTQKYNRMMHYECPRCGYSTEQITNYRRHVARKTICMPTVSNVVPSFTNKIMSKALPEGASLHHNVSGYSDGIPDVDGIPSSSQKNASMGSHEKVSSPQQNVSISGDNNINRVSMTNNNTNNITNVVLAFGKEDMSFLTPELLTKLVEKAQESGDDVVTSMVRLVFFNPAMPENMSVCLSKKGGGGKVDVFNGDKWREQDTKITAFHMATGCASELVEHADANHHVVPRGAAAHVDAYYDTMTQESPVVDKTINIVRDNSFMVPHYSYSSS